MAGKLKLEFRLHEGDVGKGKILIPRFARFRGIRTQGAIRHWNYFKHLPPEYDFGAKNAKKKEVKSLLLKSLGTAMESGGEMDLSPLRDDVRISGKVHGINPLHNAFLLLKELAEANPSYPFHGKWGGNMRNKPGKGIVFYVENEADALALLPQIELAASSRGIFVELHKKFGISAYKRFVTIDDALSSAVTNPEGFKEKLEDLFDYPDFFNELFTKNMRNVELKMRWLSWPWD